jgi:cytochrome c-type biogenesis protein CcmH/NrfF
MFSPRSTSVEWVACPRCRGQRCSMCQDHGEVVRGVALLWCALMQTVDDATPEEKAEILTYALREYGERIVRHPRTPLDKQLDDLGFP